MTSSNKGCCKGCKFSDQDAPTDGSTKEDFELLTALGKGAFGEVFLARRKVDGPDEGREGDPSDLVALKVMDKAAILKNRWVERIQTESAVLCRIAPHPYIVKVKETFQSEHKLFIVMEYYGGGSLEALLQRVPDHRLPEPNARFYAAQIFSALHHLHNQRIVYRDLKPLNIMLSSDGHAHLVDMGLCKILESSESLVSGDCFVGTPAYMAPEILRGNEYGFAVDWWSFGVLLHRMLCGTLPFTGTSIRQVVLDHILCVHLTLENVSWLSANGRSLILTLLDKHDVRRLCCAPIKDHPFFDGMDWDSLSRKELTPPPLPDGLTLTQSVTCSSHSPAAPLTTLCDEICAKKAKGGVVTFLKSKTGALTCSDIPAEQQQCFQGFTCLCQSPLLGPSNPP